MNAIFEQNRASSDTDKIAAALATAGSISRRLGDCTWHAEFPGLRLNVRQSEGWYRLNWPGENGLAPMTIRPELTPQQLLIWNGTLPGCARFGLDTRSNINLQAEIPITDEEDSTPALCQACAGITTGWQFLKESKPAVAIPTSITATTTDNLPTTERLKASCQETRWMCVEDSQGLLAVTLDAARNSPPAILIALPGQGFQAQVALTDFESLTGPCREALAVLLLHLSCLIRFARPALLQHQGALHASLEVRVEYPWNQSLLNDALASLSVACDLWANEVRSLCHESIAKEYLCRWEVGQNQPNKKE